MPHLTVHETMQFHARMVIESVRDSDQTIESVMQQLGLLACKSLMVGGKDFKGIYLNTNSLVH